MRRLAAPVAELARRAAAHSVALECRVVSGTESEASDGVPELPDPSDRPNQQAPWFRFALIFGLMAIASEVLYYAVALDSEGFETYLAGIARISAWVLNFFDGEVVVTGSRIAGGSFAVLVAQGCDAIQVCSLLAAAIIAFPLSLRAKLRGLVVGIAILQILNLLRVITLFWIGVHFSSIFKTSHEVLWPGLLIVSTIVIWILWVRFETQALDDAE